MKVTDLVAETLARNGISTIYGLQGGSVAHLFDSFHKYGFKISYLHHEESCAFAAAAEAFSTGKVSVLVVTTGPAGTNAITGVLAAWQDSLPLLIISGQARTNQVSYGLGIRQFGSQEAPILDLVSPITKKTQFIDNKERVNEFIQEAIDECYSNRQGPVWIDLPIDVQLQEVELDKSEPRIREIPDTNSSNLDGLYGVIQEFNKSRFPVLLLGGGARATFRGFVHDTLLEGIAFPVLLSWTAATLASRVSNYSGIPGPFGHKSANAILNKADFIISVGSNLGPNILGNNVVEINKKSIANLNIDVDSMAFSNQRIGAKGIVCSAEEFYLNLYPQLLRRDFALDGHGIDLETNYAESEQSLVETFQSEKLLHSHGVVTKLTSNLEWENIIIDGGGTALYSAFQGARLENIRNVICSAAVSSMGTGLAQAIPFCNDLTRSLVVIGDGSFIMAIRDLASLKIRSKTLIVVINNKGYLAIRHTQESFLESRFYGTFFGEDEPLPKIEPIVRSFGCDYLAIRTPEDVESLSRIEVEKLTVAEVYCSPRQPPMWPVSKATFEKK
jgi:acetolactate synthase-1/2/3 large subunit